MDREEFEQMVGQVLDGFPPQIQRQIANVAIVVEEWADKETLEMAGLDEPEDLLGFYYGIPLTERTHDYGLVLPDKISLFRQPILLGCAGKEEIRAAIEQTLRHELAHYFGIDDDRLSEIGAY